MTVVLDPSQDGLAQIAGALQDIRDVETIPIVSLGTQGKLYLGGNVVNNDTLAANSSTLAAN